MSARPSHKKANSKPPGNVQAADGRLTTAVRVRPPGTGIGSDDQKVYVSGGKEYIPDFVFGPDHKTVDVFSRAVAPLVRSVLDGFNATLMAYGQTGSGKTYTIQGLLKPIVNALMEDSGVCITATYCEIYKENVYDLLMGGERKHVAMKSKGGGFYVQDTKKLVVTDSRMLMAALKSTKRTTSSTTYNLTSSRSHAILRLVVERVGPRGAARKSEMTVVDLAGSEKLHDGDPAETKAINQSLGSLGRVIHALIEKKGQHVPYRDSVLTQLLMNALGGNCLTMMIACVRGGESADDLSTMAETSNTLDWASRAMRIINNPHATVEKYIGKTKSTSSISDQERMELEGVIETMRSKVGHLESFVNRVQDVIRMLHFARSQHERDVAIDMMTQMLPDNDTTMNADASLYKKRVVEIPSELEEQKQIVETNPPPPPIPEQQTTSEEVDSVVSANKDSSVVDTTSDVSSVQLTSGGMGGGGVGGGGGFASSMSSRSVNHYCSVLMAFVHNDKEGIDELDEEEDFIEVAPRPEIGFTMCATSSASSDNNTQ